MSDLELPLVQIIVLSIVQGITEFLPISSSGHLAILSDIAGWKDQGQAMDVMVHVGSFFAVVVYFWKDIFWLTGGAFDLVRGRVTNAGRIALYIILATIPALAFGLFLKLSGMLDVMRADVALKFKIVGWGALFFGALLYLAGVVGKRLKTMEEMKLSPALVIGLSQALALIPGTSRSGITMTAARFLGFKREEAARFSFLLGVPAIGAAGALTVLELVQTGGGIPGAAYLAAGLTFLTSIAAIAFLMALVKRMSFLPFVAYRFALGFFLLYLAYQPDLIPVHHAM